MKDKQLPGGYEFASFYLDLKKRRLTCGETLVPLTPKEFEILLLLVENAGRIVEKDVLLESIWMDAYVEEGTLTRNISWLRKKLALYVAEDFKIIETLPKRGYRFLPIVTRREPVESLLAGQTSLLFQTEEGPDAMLFAGEVVTPAEKSVLTAHTNKENSPDNSQQISSPELLPVAPIKRSSSKIWILPVFVIFLLTALVAYLGYFSKKQPSVIMASKIAPLSGLPGRENSPAFSPDGKQMVYSWDGGIEGSNSDIYIKLIGAGEPVRLTTNSADEINPVFSPGGKSIAFVRVFPTHNEIIMIPALGGAERKIYEQASYASISFSPDGKYLALANLDLSQNEAGIFLLNLQNGEKTRLTTPETPAVDHTPRFSPDGKSLAFIRYFSSFRREVFVVSAAGGAPRQITSDNTRIYGMAWRADSQKIFFTSFRILNQLNLWQTSVNESAEPQLITTGSKSLESVAISPDSRTIAFVEETADENIWELAPNPAPQLLIRSIRADHSPQFSPDGAQIVFASDRTGNYEIWLSDANGRNQRQLTDSQGSAGSPRFSPDGKSIVYDAQSEGKSNIFIVSANGGAPRNLTENDKNNSLPAWSADGESIFFLSNRNGSDQLWKIQASGGEAVQITKQGAFETFAAPDGKHLIYSKGSGKSGLWEISTDGSEEKPIPEIAEAGSWRSWTVAAGGVYYTAPNTQPPYQVKFFDLSTRQTKNVLSVEKPPLTYYANLCATADGKKILYAKQDQSADTILLAQLEESP